MFSCAVELVSASSTQAQAVASSFTLSFTDLTDDIPAVPIERNTGPTRWELEPPNKTR
jgi:hypothetical protein